MEAYVAQRINADRHERTDERETYRNGFRDRQFNTRLGTLDLRIPKLREGTYFPPFLEARRLSEKALNAVILEAWINGVSTRKVDALVQSMGMTGISRSQVSAICRGIDERVQAFLQRPLEGEWPYLWLDATYVRGRKDGRVVSVAVIMALMGWSPLPKTASECQSGECKFPLMREATTMKTTTIGIDLAKHLFQLHGVDRKRPATTVW